MIQEFKEFNPIKRKVKMVLGDKDFADCSIYEKNFLKQNYKSAPFMFSEPLIGN